jgi:Transcriptional repressor TCF25
MQFLSAVESLNPDEIMRILNAHPLHIDSMLQLSEICKMGEDSAMATELIGTAFIFLFFYACYTEQLLFWYR